MRGGGHFIMFSRLIANKNKIRRYEYAKDSRELTTTSHPLLRICVSVSSLKKSQPQAVILLGREQIRKYVKEPYGTIYLRWRLACFLAYLCGSQDFVPPLPCTDVPMHR